VKRIDPSVAAIVWLACPSLVMATDPAPPADPNAATDPHASADPHAAGTTALEHAAGDPGAAHAASPNLFSVDPGLDLTILTSSSWSSCGSRHESLMKSLTDRQRNIEERSRCPAHQDGRWRYSEV
jgi:hypothetical protein